MLLAGGGLLLSARFDSDSKRDEMSNRQVSASSPSPELINLLDRLGLATYFLWHNLSDLLYGRIHELSLPGLLGGAIAFAATVWALGRWLRSLAA